MTSLLTGTVAQVEWAERIRLQAAAEFDRVAQAIRVASAGQTGADLAETQILLTVLEENRARVMAQDRAGYFIREWQELSGQVRQMIARDPRYQTIQTARAARRSHGSATKQETRTI